MSARRLAKRILYRLGLVLLSSVLTLLATEFVLRSVDLRPALPAFVTVQEYREMLARLGREEPPAGLPEGGLLARNLPGTGGFPIPPGRVLQPKPEGVFRIFALGGSTTYGLPFTQAAGQNRDLSFPAWLRLRLDRRYPDLCVELHNAGAIGQTFEGAVAYALECLDYEPDLFLFYSGHNEYLPHALLLARARAASGTVVSPASPLLLTQLGRLWQDFALSIQEKKNPRLGSLDFPIVDRMVGQGYHSEHEVAVIESSYAKNLELLADSCASAGVALAVCTVASNLLDYEPSLSFVREKVEPGREEEWIATLEKAAAAFRAGRVDGALERLGELDELGSTLAEAHYWRGRCLLAKGRREEARRELVLANDKDGVVRRVISNQNQTLREFAGERGLILVDLEKAFDASAGDSLPGNSLFYDHVHPNLDGTEVLVNEVERVLVDSGVIPGTAQPAESRDVMVELEELGFVPEMLAVVNSTQALAFGSLILLRLYDPGLRLAAARRLLETIPRVPGHNFLRSQVMLGCLEILAGDEAAGKAHLAGARKVDAAMLDRILRGFVERSQSSSIRRIFDEARVIEEFGLPE